MPVGDLIAILLALVVLIALRRLKGELMTEKQEVLDALNALKTRVDKFVKAHTQDVAAKIAAAVEAKRVEMVAEDKTMDAADFAEFMVGIGGIASTLPAEEFDPSANG